MRRLLPTLVLLMGCPAPTDTDVPEVDADGDGFTSDVDCDDTNADVFPGAPELCNLVDDDCDDETDEQATDRTSFYRDADRDGFGDSGNVQFACERPDGYSAEPGDCDDVNDERYPGRAEICNQVDDDCNEIVDDDPVDGSPWYPDRDRDGYGGDDQVVQACRPVPEHLPTGGDCDDSDATINPDGQEICDEGEGDEDCDGLVNDEDDSMIGAPAWFLDEDGDGYGDRDNPVFQCAAPTDRSPIGDDCDDTRPEVNPDGTEICGNDLDDDCNDHAATCGVVGRMTVDLSDSTWDGVWNGTEMGRSVFGLPDQNGDDRGELGFGQPRHDGPGTKLVNMGRAGLIYGPALGGDTNIVDHFWSSETQASLFGEQVLVAGDLDGDDLHEIWFSANGTNPREVHLTDLDEESAGLILRSSGLTYDGFGDSLGLLIDVTDDGVNDVVVGAPRHQAEGSAVGAAYIFDAALTGTQSLADAEGAIIGERVAAACGAAVDGGDYDADGVSDLAIGCPGSSSTRGVILLFDEVPSGTVTASDADQSFLGAKDGYAPGASLAHGDLNDDGYDDLIVGSPGYSGAPTFEGTVHVFFGPIPDGVDFSKADRVWTGESARDGFGEQLAVGDVDGDGVQSLLVGVPGVASYAGRAYLFEGSDMSGPASGATAILDGDKRGDYFGAGVAIVPDLDKDGYDDVVVGAPGKFGTTRDSGGLWVWRGGPGY